jgi:hypothetical protein
VGGQEVVVAIGGARRGGLGREMNRQALRERER